MSTNVSKLRRDYLIDKIKEIKDYILDAAQDENFFQLLSYLVDIEKEIKGKKYGLVFEEHKEHIDDLLMKHVPVITEDKELFIDNGGKMNFLIEGDNLASLQLLTKTHKEKIDLIIIDPPYNRGKEDFIYDDNYIDSLDLFTHSKWASFISKRLKLAQSLLNENGYIFINIDENELYSLKLICDEIFSEKNFVGMYMWEKTSTPPALSKKIRKKLEYILCYAKKNNSQKQFSQGRIDGGDAPLLNTGNAVKKLVFPPLSVHFKIPDGIYKAGAYNKLTLLKDVVVKDGKNQDELIVEAEFKWGQKMLNEELSMGTYFLVKSKNFSMRYQRVNIEKVKTPQNILNSELNIGTNEEAAKELSTLGIRDFPYPKPTSLYTFLIEMINSGKDLTILDFFAGSGTTGHAAMELNAEDEGKRNFILCTNNENNICREITYERIKRVIAKENYKEGLKYYKVEYLPITDKLYYEYADELLKHIRELVELENGINFIGNSEIAIILTEEELDSFTSTLNESFPCKSIYLGHDVLPDEQQEALFKKYNIKINIIPDYYYRDLEG
ncbi:MAG: site-specific DNA-methyltransferase [Anaeroplasma bactoclasticum]|nr:site-specific DNA-methyltransferase [Anaeroplasma bactoclasticum]